MKASAFNLWLVGALIVGRSVAGSAALTTNSWISTLGVQWQGAGNWSAGVAPSTSQSAIIVSNGVFSFFTPSKEIIIDSTTSTGTPSSLTISNLTISAPLLHNGLQTAQAFNELIISNIAPATFTVLNTILLTTGSVMSASNSTISAGTLIDDGYLEVDGAGLLTATYPYVGYNRKAQLAVIGGTWQTGNAYIGYNSGSAGELDVTGGGSVLVNSGDTISVGYNGGATGSIWLDDGQLNGIVELGYEGSGEMTISNGTVQGNVDVCGFNGLGTGVGTLTVAGGAVSGSVDVAYGETSGSGFVWLNGGQIINPGTLYLGDQGTGQMTVSNGFFSTEGMEIGYFVGSQGTLTIAGGTNVLSSFVHVSRGGTTGTIWLNGGLLLTTNDLTNLGDQGGFGQIVVSNGTWQSQRIRVGSSPEAVCLLTLDGGTTTVSSNLQIGLFDCSAAGDMTVAGGTLYVTNAQHSAVLEVESGTFTLDSGTVVVDRFVMTNACASFVRTGGTLVYGTAVLNPNLDADGDGIPNGYEQAEGLDPLDPRDASADNDGDGFSNLQEYLTGTDATNSASYFHITNVVPAGNDVRVTWMMGPGRTNALQRTAVGADGSYQTNAFVDLFTVTNTVGSVTNYLDLGGATNGPSRFYRVRLVP
ncbi:MAG TPA: hypothetical protein VMV72_19865 [Verrucomicrobiae bacterium]|nr:hypothetical protein [Verrucomicrobiae bacterium]